MVMMVRWNGSVWLLPVMRVVRSLSHGHVHGRSGVPLPRPLFWQGLKLLQGDHGRGGGGPVLGLGARVEQGGLGLLSPVLERLRSDRVSLKSFLSELGLRPRCSLPYDFRLPALPIPLILWSIITLLTRLRYHIGHLGRLWH